MKKNNKSIPKTINYIENRMIGYPLDVSYLTMTLLEAQQMIQFIYDNFSDIENQFSNKDELIHEALENNGMTSVYYHGVQIKLW